MNPTSPRFLPHLLLLLALLTGFRALPAQNSRNVRQLKSRQAALRQQITESEKLLKNTKKDVRAQLSNLMLLNSQIDTQQQYVDGVRSQIDTLNGHIGDLERQLAVLRRDLAECKRKYHRSVVYLFRNRLTQNKLMFIFSAKNFRQMYRRARYVMEYAKYQRAQGEVIRRKEAAVKSKQAELLAARTEKNGLLAEGRQVQSRLETQKQERQGIVAELNKKQGQLQSSINRRRKEYAALNARIDRLIKEEIAAAERRRRAAEAKARREREAKEKRERERREAEARRRRNAERQSANRRGGTASRGGNRRSGGSSGSTAEPAFRSADNADRRLSNNFAANKGRLPVPITGSYFISSHYGEYTVKDLGDVKLDNKGINLTGRGGAQARCVFDGEVSSVFSFGGLMNVIVRHGSYITVYCNLSSVSVRQGQRVTARQTLGAIAPDGSGNRTLHFQLRKETAKLNPEQWIGR